MIIRYLLNKVLNLFAVVKISVNNYRYIFCNALFDFWNNNVIASEKIFNWYRFFIFYLVQTMLFKNRIN